MNQSLYDLPKGWKWIELGDVVEIETYSTIPKSGVCYKYIGLENIKTQTGQIISVQEVDDESIQSQKYLFDKNNVLYGKLRPYLNKVSIPTFSGICSTDILPLLAKKSVIKEYIAYWLKSESFINYANNNATGTKMPRLNSTQFKKAYIPLPPLPVQDRIVEILQKADEIRRKRQEALAIAHSILPAIFNDMFGHPEDALEKFGSAMLQELADVKSGVTKGRKLQGKETVEVPYLRVANVQDGYLDLSEIKIIEVLPNDVHKYH